MYLKSVSYQRNEINFPKINFEKINLITGLNNSGKTTILQIIQNLHELVLGNENILDSNYELEFKHNNDIIKHEFYSDGSKILNENIILNNKLILTRNDEGTVVLEDETLETKIPKHISIIAHNIYQSSHVILKLLAKFYKGLCCFCFNNNNGTEIFIKALTVYKKEFLDAIIDDMKKLGFDISDFNRTYTKYTNDSPDSFELYIKIASKIMTLNTLATSTYNILSTIIRLNVLKLVNDEDMLLLDNVCTGLDVDNSEKLMKLILEKCNEFNIKIIMTTNDKVAIDNVPLNSLIVLDRKGNISTSYDYVNAKEAFNEYADIPLGNFSFYTSKYYKRITES